MIIMTALISNPNQHFLLLRKARWSRNLCSKPLMQHLSIQQILNRNNLFSNKLIIYKLKPKLQNTKAPDPSKAKIGVVREALLNRCKRVKDLVLYRCSLLFHLNLNLITKLKLNLLSLLIKWRLRKAFQITSHPSNKYTRKIKNNKIQCLIKTAHRQLLLFKCLHHSIL